VIGEDLGTVPPGFSDQMAHAGLLGIRLLWFQRAGERFLAPDEWSPGAISTTTTHDLPTVAGWWSGCDIKWRSKLGLLEHGSSEKKELAQREEDKVALWQAMNEAEGREQEEGTSPPEAPPLMEAIRYIGKAACPLAILPMEDALNMPEQPNLPGTIDEHPNWRRRLPGNTNELLDRPEVVARLSALDRSRKPRGEGE
jgi:4-alpha-glucanotransferase